MSAYGGQPPGWDPQNQYPGGYGPPGVPAGQTSNGSAIAALICNSLLVLFCCNVFAIPGIVTGAMATSRAATDPESSRSLALWSWVIFVCSLALAIVAFAILIVIGAFEDSTI